MAGFKAEANQLTDDLDQDRGVPNPEDHGHNLLNPTMPLRQMLGSQEKMFGVYTAWRQSGRQWRQKYIGKDVEPYIENRSLPDVGGDGTARAFSELFFPRIETINFGFIFGLYARTKNLSSAGGHFESIMGTAKKTLSDGWSGAAADAALKKFDTVADAAHAYQESNGVIADASLLLWRKTRDAVKGLIDALATSQLLKFYAGMTPDDFKDWYERIAYLKLLEDLGVSNVNQYCDRAINDPGSIENLPNRPKELAALDGTLYIKMNVGYIAGWQIWLNDMSNNYSVDIENLRKAVYQTVQTLDEAFDTFGEAVGQLRYKDGDLLRDDPFRELRPPEAKAPASDKGGNTDPGPGTGAASYGGGGASYGGGGGYGGGQSYPAPTETPTIPSAADYAADYASMTDPTTDPTAGLTSPSSVTQPETVTINDGDRQISVQSPDGQGNVKVTVDDGDGKPKTYNMDFSQGAGGLKGTPGGSASGTADDKVVIKDGETTITAEQADGGDGQIKITVDDGTGDPTTYNVDFSEGQGGAPTDQPLASGQTNGQPTDPSTGGSAATGSGGGAGVGGGGHAAAVHSGATTGVDASASSGAGPDPQTTSPQATALGGSAAGAAGSYGAAGQDHDHHNGFDADPSSNIAAAAAPGDAQLAAAPDSGGNSGGGSGGMGGMPMMGGGMGGGGGGGGGDTSRGGGSNWRATGNLFADEEPAFEEGDLTSDDPADW